MIDWANSQDLAAMLSVIPDGSHKSELRLFCADCAARCLRFLTEPVFSNALDCSRRFATGAANATDLQSLVDAACSLIPEHIDVPTVRELAASAVIDASSVSPTSKSKVDCVVSCAAQAVAQFHAESVADVDFDTTFETEHQTETRIQCKLLRDRIPSLNV